MSGPVSVPLVLPTMSHSKKKPMIIAVQNVLAPGYSLFILLVYRVGAELLFVLLHSESQCS